MAEYYLANPDFVRLSIELAQRKHNVSVATSFRTLDKQVFDPNVKIFEISPFITLYRLPHTLSFPPAKIYRIAREQNIDVIHAINDHSTNVALAALVSKLTAIPLVYAIQGPGTRTGDPVVDLVVSCYDLTVERWISKTARKVILLSESLASTAKKLKVDENKLAVIPSGVDQAHFNPESPEVREKAAHLRDELNIGDSIVLGYVGRLVPAKGLVDLFTATRQIEDRFPNILLLIVGEGAQRNDLEALSRKLQVKTIFAGWQHDTVPYYALMDVFVLPSLYEGLPNVVLEAMAMKKPVVATNVGGNPDLLSNGENGFLVSVQDSHQLASALEKVIEDDELRRRMGTANRRKVEGFYTWGTTVADVENVYNEIV